MKGRGYEFGSLLGSIAAMPPVMGLITDRINPQVAGLVVAGVLALLAIFLLKTLPILYPPRSGIGAPHRWRRRPIEEEAVDIKNLI